MLLIIGLAAYAIGQWRDDTWRPVAELHCPTLLPGHHPRVDLSHSGDVISASAPLLRGVSSVIVIPMHNFSKQGRRYEQEVIKTPPYSHLLGENRIAPNGQQAAIVSYENAPICLLDLKTKQTVGEVHIPESIHGAEYSLDGSQLLVTTSTPRIQRLRTFDVASQREISVQLFPFAGSLHVCPSGQLLARTVRVVLEKSEAGIELGETDLEILTPDGDVLGKIKNTPWLGKPLFALDHQRVAMGNRIWNRANNRIDTMPGDVVGLIGSQQTLVLRKELSPVWRDYLPAWLAEMPFLRHALNARPQGELLLMDQVEGTVIARTTRVADMVEAKVSRDGTTAIGSCWDGRILVWQIPLAAQPLTPALSPEYRGEGGRPMQTSDTQAPTPDS
jgi:hypothetical protein